MCSIPCRPITMTAATRLAFPSNRHPTISASVYTSSAFRKSSSLTWLTRITPIKEGRESRRHHKTSSSRKSQGYQVLCQRAVGKLNRLIGGVDTGTWSLNATFSNKDAVPAPRFLLRANIDDKVPQSWYTPRPTNLTVAECTSPNLRQRIRAPTNQEVLSDSWAGCEARKQEKVSHLPSRKSTKPSPRRSCTCAEAYSQTTLDLVRPSLRLVLFTPRSLKKPRMPILWPT